MEKKNGFMKQVITLAMAAVLVALPATALRAQAQEVVRTEDVVVTATKMAEPREEVTSDVIVIDAEEIERTGAEFLPDVLKQVTELNVIQNGGPGKSASVQLRGGDSTQVVIMIDGVKVKSTTLGYFDLSGIRASDIARIEIVKGPQSTMYGSEAMTGVINIITKKGRPGFSIGGAYESGAFKTKSSEAFVSGGGKTWNFRGSVSKYETEGISVYPDGDEEDGYEREGYSAKAGLMLAKNVEVELSRSYYEDENDLDYGSDLDDTNYLTKGEHSVDTAKAVVYMAEIWEQVLTVSKAKDFVETEDPDAAWLNSEITSEMETTDWQHNLYISPVFTLSFGYEERVEKGENKGVFDEKVSNKAVYMNIKQSNERATMTIGGRYDDHEEFGEESTYRVGVIEKIAPNARFRASYGTGFRAPTLNQLYYQSAWSTGNPDLDPERSTAWEIGLEQDLGENSMFSITYFEQKYRDLIEWVEVAPWTWQPENVSRAKVKGVETTLAYNGPTLLFKASHTHLETEDDDGKRLRRRPKDKYFLLLGYQGPSFELSADYTYVGMRFDSNAEQDPLDAYQIVNVQGAVKFGNYVKLYARGENVTDEEYELAGGYNTPGESYYMGIQLEF